jgi:3-oxoacyl-[acyl-carrier-protein] synthase II
MTLLDDVVTYPKANGQPSAGVARRTRSPRVALRSWSMMTTFGASRATWDALLCGESITDHARCDDVRGNSRVSQLARRVAHEAAPESLDGGTAVIVGTSKGSVESWLDGAVPAAGLAEIAEAVATTLRLHGPRLTVSAACASGLHALVRGAMMIRSGEARQVLVVAAEASVHPLFLGGFQRLGVLAAPGAGCRPFDRNRSGFYMSEAAAAVVLEAEDGDRAEESAGRIYLENFALGGDATHLTGGDPHLRTLRHLLARVIGGRPVDLVHAHGTGTPTNDDAELAAIESAVTRRRNPPSLYSHKGALGHSLGAAGLVSVVINCQAHLTSIVPPNAQTREPIETSRLALSTGIVRRPIRRSIAIAAGFGGATAVVGLRGAPAF